MNFEGKNKDPGTDQINVELIKLLPEIIHKKSQISTILQPQEMKSRTVFMSTTNTRKEINTKSSTNNCFNSSQKNVSSIYENNSRLDQILRNPVPQTAYRKDGSTKLIIERSRSSRNKAASLLLLDMSKAFDSFYRNTVACCILLEL